MSKITNFKPNISTGNTNKHEIIKGHTSCTEKLIFQSYILFKFKKVKIKVIIFAIKRKWAEQTIEELYANLRMFTQRR